MSKSQCLPHIMAAKQMVQIWIGEITSLPRYVCSERDMSGGMGERQANRRSRVEDVYRRVSLPLAVCLTTWTEKLQTTIPVAVSALVHGTATCAYRVDDAPGISFTQDGTNGRTDRHQTVACTLLVMTRPT